MIMHLLNPSFHSDKDIRLTLRKNIRCTHCYTSQSSFYASTTLHNAQFQYQFTLTHCCLLQLEVAPTVQHCIPLFEGVGLSSTIQQLSGTALPRSSAVNQPYTVNQWFESLQAIISFSYSGHQVCKLSQHNSIDNSGIRKPQHIIDSCWELPCTITCVLPVLSVYTLWDIVPPNFNIYLHCTFNFTSELICQYI